MLILALVGSWLVLGWLRVLPLALHIIYTKNHEKTQTI